MGAALVVAHDGAFYLVQGPGEARRFVAPPARTDRGEPGGPPRLPEALLAALAASAPSVPIRVCGRELAAAIASRLSRPVPPAETAEWHAALAAVPRPDPRTEHESVLARARADLDAGLRSPSETLVALAREEARFERAVGREERAAETFVAVPGTVLAEHADAWRRTRDLLAAQHHELVRRLEAEAERTAPNLSAIVGARTAARLVAAAGGLVPLARMPAARLQLLGSRRRPDPVRGPRFGAIYLADGADAVPPDRRGAFARSVAALAAIAARADAWTHADLVPRLRARRDARVEQLRRRRR